MTDSKKAAKTPASKRTTAPAKGGGKAVATAKKPTVKNRQAESRSTGKANAQSRKEAGNSAGSASQLH